MKLNSHALLVATAIGGVIRIFFAVCINSAAFSMPLGRYVGLTELVMLRTVELVLVTCNWIVTLVVGFLYAYLASRPEPLKALDGAAGGALATAFAGFIGALLSACFLGSALLTVGQRQGLGTNALLRAAVGPILIQLCVGPLGGAVAGAISGLVGALTVGRAKA